MPWPPQPEHVSESDIELYVMRRLSPAENSRVEDHLVRCRDCCLRVIRDEHFLELLRSAIRYEGQANPLRETNSDVLEVLTTRISDGHEGVLLALRQDAFVELDGRPWPGLILSPAQARLLAARLELFAAEIECREQS